jgi:rhodanese-related sulfurtransferase
VEQLSEFVLNHLMLFAALLVVLVLLIRAELDHQANKGLLVSPASAIRVINNHDDVLILDIRSANEYKSGHIQGARNVPLNELTKKLESWSEFKNRPVVLYCNTGTTTSRAVRLLKKAGFEQINNLEGGVVAWKEANLPLLKK